MSTDSKVLLATPFEKQVEDSTKEKVTALLYLILTTATPRRTHLRFPHSLKDVVQKRTECSKSSA